MALTGASKTVFIVGDPVAQVKSPAGMTRYFQEECGKDIVVVPACVPAESFEAFIDGARSMSNCLGLIATIPHKVRLLESCAGSTAAARIIGAANVARFEAGDLFGDHVDGLGMLAAARTKMIAIERKRALLLGAGGAGSAIAHALLDAGLDHLTIRDAVQIHADRLVERLSGIFPGRVSAVSPSGPWQILINATPLGMREGDPTAFDRRTIGDAEAVLDAVTATRVTGLIGLAEQLGRKTVSGDEMFRGLRAPMAAFFLGCPSRV